MLDDVHGRAAPVQGAASRTLARTLERPAERSTRASQATPRPQPALAPALARQRHVRRSIFCRDPHKIFIRSFTALETSLMPLYTTLNHFRPRPAPSSKGKANKYVKYTDLP
jgi:hypothetical protein